MKKKVILSAVITVGAVIAWGIYKCAKGWHDYVNGTYDDYVDDFPSPEAEPNVERSDVEPDIADEANIPDPAEASGD